MESLSYPLSDGKSQNTQFERKMTVAIREQTMTGQRPRENDVIFKVCEASAWADAKRVGAYTGSTDDIRDGYIHFSTAVQVEGTLAKYFAGRSDLVLLAIPVPALGAALRFEPSRGGALFPHLYGPLPVAAVAWDRPLALGADGNHLLPDLSSFGVAG